MNTGEGNVQQITDLKCRGTEGPASNGEAVSVAVLFSGSGFGNASSRVIHAFWSDHALSICVHETVSVPE